MNVFAISFSNSDRYFEKSFHDVACITFMMSTVIENLAGPSAFIRLYPAPC